eukprot:1149862-Pelagomonas_calceolata.AAC.4
MAHRTSSPHGICYMQHAILVDGEARMKHGTCTNMAAAAAAAHPQHHCISCRMPHSHSVTTAASAAGCPTLTL